MWEKRFFMDKQSGSICRVLAVLLSLGLFFVVAGTASAHAAHAKVLSAVPATVTVFTAENIRVSRF